ncbi:MAG: B-box zinc finger protein [Chloroflexi bacterium]|nr:B-box zinc finger protein [Chloroflexota bacterium]
MSESSETLTYCAVHPDRETALRCNQCGRYMCAQCAVSTPVGYRCRECTRRHEDKFFNAAPHDGLLIAGVCGGLALLLGIAVMVLPLVGYLLFALILGVPAGGAIAEAALRLTERRRGRHSAYIGAAATVIGGLAGIVGVTAVNFVQYSAQFADLMQRYGPMVARANFAEPTAAYFLQMVLSSSGPLLFVALAAFAVYARYRLRM